MESIQSKLFKFMLRIVNIKKMWQVTGNKLKKNMVNIKYFKNHIINIDFFPITKSDLK